MSRFYPQPLAPEARPMACPQCRVTMAVVWVTPVVAHRQCAACGIDLPDSPAISPSEVPRYTRVIRERWARNRAAYLAWEGYDVLTFLEECY